MNSNNKALYIYIYIDVLFFLYASCKKPLLPFACGDYRKRAKEEYSWDLCVSHRMEGKRGRAGWTSDSYPAAEPLLSPGRRFFYGARSGYKALSGSVFFSSSLSTALTYSSCFSVHTQTLTLDHLSQKKLFKPLCCGRLAFFFPRRSFLLFSPLFTLPHFSFFSLSCCSFFSVMLDKSLFFLNAFLLAFILISPPVTHIAFKRLALSPLCGKERKKKVTRKHTSVDRIF